MLPEVIDVLLKKAVTPPPKLAVLLGHVIGTSLRLRHKPKTNVPDGRALIDSKKVRLLCGALGLTPGRDRDILLDACARLEDCPAEIHTESLCGILGELCRPCDADAEAAASRRENAAAVAGSGLGPYVAWQNPA